MLKASKLRFLPDRAGLAHKELPTVQEYVLIGSTSKEIIVYRRENNWRPYHYREDVPVELKSIEVSFPFDALYRRIPL